LNKKFEEKPICSDSSLDQKTIIGGNQIETKPGGCATVAGWGGKYDEFQHQDHYTNCTTDFDALTQDKLK